VRDRGDDPRVFSAYRGALNLSLPFGQQTGGLRRAQVAAIWAASGHLAQKKATDAQLVLPTGTGKTAVMTALPFALRSERPLIVVPSDLIRRQVAREFSTLRVLRSQNVIATETPRLKVKAVQNRLSSIDDWRALSAYDVIVATPQCVSPHYSGVSVPPAGYIDLVVVDEAHHSAAATWSELLDAIDAKKALLTATPFRTDGKRLRGEIVFWYSLAEAIADGIYSPIDFIPVRRVAGESKDETLARAVKRRLSAEPHRTTGAQVVVRTDRQSDAYRLRHVYEQVGLDFPVLLGSLSKAETDKIISDLEGRRVQGVIVVGVLTEGFDLPSLKIAAYHVKHQSFPATLQFIGRLARPIAGMRMQPELLAFADDITSDTSDLYREESSWRELLPDIADAAVAEEKQNRAYAAGFSSRPEAFSIESLQPKLFARVYEVQGPVPQLQEIDPDNLEIPRSEVKFSFVDDERRLVAIVSLRKNHPAWIASPIFDQPEYRLHIVMIDASRRFVFVHTDSEVEARELLRYYGMETATPVPARVFSSAMHTFNIDAYSSVGLRATALRSVVGASYKSIAGQAAEAGVSVADESGTVAGHLIGRFRDGNATDSIGMALESAKIWQVHRGALLKYREWCDGVAVRLIGAPQTEHPPMLRIAVAEHLKAYPRNPIAVVMLPDILEDVVVETVAGNLVRLSELTIRARSMVDRLVLGIQDDRTVLGFFSIALDGQVTARRGTLNAQFRNQRVPLSNIFTDYPPQVFYADGSSSLRHSLTLPQAIGLLLDPATTVVDGFIDVDIRKEAKPPRPPFLKNIQSAAKDRLSLTDRDFLLIDDGANELADLILIRRMSEAMCEVHFIHCKWSGANTPGRRLDDIYGLLGQCTRSAIWSRPEVLCTELLRRINDRAATKIDHGEEADLVTYLKQWVTRPPAVGCIVTAVQPGVSHAELAGWREGSTLIAATSNWCGELGARFSFVMSP
jgi:superfamily II DNA or RNA helicase